MLPENSAAPILSVNTYTNYSSSDYNGFGLKAAAQPAFQWNSPEWSVAAADTKTTDVGKLVQRKFARSTSPSRPPGRPGLTGPPKSALTKYPAESGETIAASNGRHRDRI